ncbi:MAG: hypothetical protein AAF736_16045, partial [Pseudomonadota bacterium]
LSFKVAQTFKRAKQRDLHKILGFGGVSAPGRQTAAREAAQHGEHALEQRVARRVVTAVGLIEKRCGRDSRLLGF